MPTNVMVLALDEHNERILRGLPDAEQYRFHSLLSRAELFGGEIPLCDVLDKAAGQLEAFEGPVDAIIGFWDFPCCASLEAVVKCEHKYWSRLE